MNASARCNEFRQANAGNAVGNYRAARMFAQYYIRDKRNKGIPIDGPALLIDNGRTVYIGIEDDAEIARYASLRCRWNTSPLHFAKHDWGTFRPALKLACGDICAERPKHNRQRIHLRHYQHPP